MVKSFKEFWRSYWELCKESGQWMKKHWIGYTILCIFVFVVTFLCYYIPEKISSWNAKRTFYKEHKDDVEEE